MSHNNISIFIPHIGCPNKCSFCNQNSITGQCDAPAPFEVKAVCKKAFFEIKDKHNTEIAFFGGSFTAIDRQYMIDLLESVQEFIGVDKFKGIRISTRPDCIDDNILKILKKYNVTSIELGAQSMDDNVLLENNRGHTSKDVIKASNLIKDFGFELGLQMMVGLYKSTPEKDINTALDIIKLKPDTVRIYPVVILEYTRLGELFKKGEYKTYELDTAVEICSQLIELFNTADIRIIKLGLHASELVEGQMLGGIYHPAFRELCDNRIFLKKIIAQTQENKKYIVYVASSAVSKAIGQKRHNITELERLGRKVTIKPDTTLENYDVKIIEEETACT